jgi:hypothetical protein
VPETCAGPSSRLSRHFSCLPSPIGCGRGAESEGGVAALKMTLVASQRYAPSYHRARGGQASAAILALTDSRPAGRPARP